MDQTSAVNTEERAALVVVNGVPKTLAYSFSSEQSGITVGAEVLVEVGRRQTRGYVIEELSLRDAVEKLKLDQQPQLATSPQLSLLPGLTSAPASKLKPVLGAQPAFQPDQLSLFRWMARYYGVSLAEVIENALPKRSSGRPVTWVAITPHALDQLKHSPDFFAALQRRSPLQAKVLNQLQLQNDGLALAALEQELPGARAAVTALGKKGLAAVTQISANAVLDSKAQNRAPGQFASPEPAALTVAQTAALNEIETALSGGKFEPMLLFGVTGSGKTEIYIRAIEKVLATGGSALVVVPEIALTPQFLDQFQARLKQPLALLHSQVGQTERWTAWEAILSGELRVAIGARSAIFAPLKNLRLVIVDEEHENSYKQSDGFRYHGRDVAVMRAKFSGCPIILGSATPSFESLFNTTKNRYRLLEMPERATERPVPILEIVDLNKVKRSEMPASNISPQLHQAITETLNQKGQVVILYNRRGFSSYLQCETCSQVLACPNCSVTLTFHKRSNRLLCHYCNLSMTPPSHCQFCRDPRTSRVDADDQGKPIERESVVQSVGLLEHRGGGTERVVDELAALFPEKTILRMDRDTVGQKDSYRRILGDMRSGQADILVGTQMVAKGHDLPGVTLVGIIDADIGLHLPDFRSSEKAFQLITQAAGRAGRGKEAGRVIVQTREPNHPTIVATATGRFKAFARFELEFRKKLGYPPWGRLMRLIISSTDRQEAHHAARTVRQALDHLILQLQENASRDPVTEESESTPRVAVLGPSPAPHEKLQARYRYHILVKSNSTKRISELATSLNRWKGTIKGYKDFRLAVDVDPVEML